MPFTLSHPAAVIPFARTRLSLSALMVGSMSPDFVYFIHLKPDGNATHTLAGVFMYCLPAGLLVLLAYHLLLKKPLLSMLAYPARQLGRGYKGLSGPQTIQKMALVSLSVVIGALTHLLWDAFTHEKGLGVQLLPFLDVTVFDLGFDNVPLTRILHHASSAIGALCLIAWVKKQIESQAMGDDSGAEPGSLSRKRFSKAMLWIFVSAGIGLVYAWSHGHPIQNYIEFRQMMVQALITTGSAIFSIMTLYSIIWHVARRRVPNPDGSR